MQPVCATQLPNLEVRWLVAPNSYSRRENDRVLFATQASGTNTKVFVYDLGSHKSVDILVVPNPVSYRENSVYTEVYSDGSVAYIVRDGDLYVTDGTKSGTAMVGDFGVYDAKDEVFNPISNGVVIDGSGAVTLIKQDSHDSNQRVGLVECLQDQLLVYSSPVNDYTPQPEQVTHWLINSNTKSIKGVSSEELLADTYLDDLPSGRAAARG